MKYSTDTSKAIKRDFKMSKAQKEKMAKDLQKVVYDKPNPKTKGKR